METHKEVQITVKLKEGFPKETLEGPLTQAIEYFNRFNFEYVEDYSIEYK